ncbi:MAG: sigma-70 family RNA polymerase sigma factor [Hamadaea sp.]|uniref:RNA polymerase sigma factor n=1 Tax=Hamadaea sp. TaxID=2024425 RepID=UPI0018459F60|nr:sigma-70 family RNA polymerase sigma factor [Hamadaea sp.]NUR74498.1 sigma-70 family RNA polymerase sigma factor [Hamadaea sp.]NUT21427.1 sigma-70 family RNA polymerase sigma factor [Hamadaea sp.]
MTLRNVRHPAPRTVDHPSGSGRVRDRAALAESDGDPWSLIERAQQGDVSAFGELYARYNAEVFRYLWQRCGHVQLAQDLAGDVWERALRGIGRLNYRGAPPLAWLMTIARNRAIDHFRSGRFRMEVLSDATRDMGQIDDSADIEQIAVTRLESAVVLRAVQELSAAQRQAITLTYFAGLTCPEAAVRMGVTEDAVKALNMRARRTMARRLSHGVERAALAG